MLGYEPQWNITDTQMDVPSVEERIALLQSARTNAISALEKAATVMKEYYDRKKSDTPELQVKDKVWLEGTNITPLRPMKKLAEKRYGPFEIIKQTGRGAYELKLPTSWKSIHPVFNKVLLTKFIEPLPSQSKIQPPPEIINGEEEYKIEAILDYKMKGRKRLYLVKWEGYDHDENTWEPKSMVKDTIALEEFENDLKG